MTDRVIQRPKQKGKWLLAFIAVATLATLGIWRINVQSGSINTRVESNRLRIAQVAGGHFEDFIPVRGTLEPAKTIFLDAVEGGRVERLFVEEGATVQAGQPILELSNPALQLEVISNEARVSEQLNNLRNTRLELERNRIALKKEAMEIDYNLGKLERQLELNRRQLEQGLISEDAFKLIEEDTRYFRKRKKVAAEDAAQELRMRELQLVQLEEGAKHLEANLEIARQNLEALTIRAPMNGLLSSLNAQLGESKSPGARIGQLDSIGAFKVTAQIDEYYLSRVQTGLKAQTTWKDQEIDLVLEKVYPEINAGLFRADFQFSSQVPSGIRRGQTLNLRLTLSQPQQAILLPRGGFFQDTGGNWVFVLEENGKIAVKKPIRLGRANSEYFEVLEGLRKGDQVIVSAYGPLSQADTLTLINGT